MCIEFPEADRQLKHWVRWRRDGCGLKELNYPTSSAHTREFGGGFHETPDDPHAEHVDRLVGEMSIKYSDIHGVLMSKYFFGDNDRSGAVNCCIPLGRYQTYVKVAVSWIDGRLCDLK